MPSSRSAYRRALRTASRGTPCSVRSDLNTCASMRLAKERVAGSRRASLSRGANCFGPAPVGYGRPTSQDRSVAEGSRR